jgi:RNA polymerase primary sigma factor
MASKTEETPQKEEMLEKDGPETLPDSPLLDLSDPAVKELIRSAKKRGYVTHDQINSVLPSDEVNSEQIKDVLAIFSEMGVNVVETEETSKERESAKRERRPTKRPGARAANWSRSSKRSRPNPRPRSRPSARMIRCACICAKWARWSFYRARARSVSPSASRPAAKQ